MYNVIRKHSSDEKKTGMEMGISYNEARKLAREYAQSVAETFSVDVIGLGQNHWSVQCQQGTTAPFTISFWIEKDQQRENDPKRYPNGRRLGCGHTVYHTNHVMGDNMDTSCPDCYAMYSLG